MNPFTDQNVSLQIDKPDSTDELASQFHEPAEQLTGRALRAYGTEVHKIRQEELIVQFIPLVHRIVSQVTSYLKPPLSREDLVSAGTIGLVKAARDFDPHKDAEFKTYAYIRIRGAVIDELRQWSFTPPAILRQYEKAQDLANQMIEENGTSPTDEQLAKALEMPVEKLYRMFEVVRARHFLSIHGLDDEAPALGECLAADSESDPAGKFEKEELIQKLSKAIQQLSVRHRRVIVLYYHQELTMKEIAEVLEITESRISQIHASAIFKLSRAMEVTVSGERN